MPSLLQPHHGRRHTAINSLVLFPSPDLLVLHLLPSSSRALLSFNFHVVLNKT
jgi:hypothetical protein